jgi:hypothetical protein
MPLQQEELQQNANKTIGWREFAGVNLTDARTSIEDKEWAWLENAIPVGRGNVRLVPGIAALETTGDDLPAEISRAYGFVLAGVSVLILIGADGSLTEVNVETGAVDTMAAAATVTTAARMTIWEDTHILIIDSTGFFSWDGTTFHEFPVVTDGNTTNTSPVITNIPSTTGFFADMPVSGTGIPAGALILSVDSATQVTLTANATATASDVALSFGTAKTGSAIAVFEGRVWIKTARRTIEYSAPATFGDFALTHGAGSTVLTDPVFIGDITNLLPALQQLWIVGEGAVNAISNVQTTGTPLATTFNNTNIVSSVGSNFPGSVSSFFRTIVFLTQYGIYAIVGATPQKLSDKLDGLFPDLTLTADCPHAIGTVHNVFIWATLVPYVPTAGLGVGASRKLLLCFAQGKWFFASAPDLTWVTSVVVDGQPEIWGTDGETIFQLFADSTEPVMYILKTKFFDFGDSTQQKHLSRLSLEFLAADVVTPSVAVENEFTRRTVPLVNAASNELTFVGTGGTLLTFEGSGGPLIFVSGGLQLIRQGRDVSMYGQYLGLTLSGSERVWTLSGLGMEVRAGGKWNSTRG